MEGSMNYLNNDMVPLSQEYVQKLATEVMRQMNTNQQQYGMGRNNVMGNLFNNRQDSFRGNNDYSNMRFKRQAEGGVTNVLDLGQASRQDRGGREARGAEDRQHDLRHEGDAHHQRQPRGRHRRHEGRAPPDGGPVRVVQEPRREGHGQLLRRRPEHPGRRPDRLRLPRQPAPGQDQGLHDLLQGRQDPELRLPGRQGQAGEELRAAAGCWTPPGSPSSRSSRSSSNSSTAARWSSWRRCRSPPPPRWKQ